MNTLKKPLIEALKETGRYIISATLAWLTSGGLEMLVHKYAGATLDPQIQIIVIGALTIFIRAVDKAVYVDDKNIEAETGVPVTNKGIFPF